MHQLFLTLGCDLDYVPIQKYEAFLMCLQFTSALWFIWWFVKMLYTFMRSALRGGM
ncbi:MAG: hypothetical protein K2H19_06170 [Ruminococcus sp.]|nr:hypothetical protein [Ruminococcus sp.]